MTLVTIATIVYRMNPAGNPTVDMDFEDCYRLPDSRSCDADRPHALDWHRKKRQVRQRALLFGYLVVLVAASAIVGYTVDFFGWDGGFGGNDWRQHSGGYLVDCCDDRKTSQTITAKRNGG